MGGKIDNVYDVIAAIKLLNNWWSEDEKYFYIIGDNL